MTLAGHAHKHWISADELLQDSVRLARTVMASGYEPQLLIGLWRGGAAIAVAVHEALAFLGQDCDHLPLRTTLYRGIAQPAAELRIEGLEMLERRNLRNSRILLVDDVFDTGRTMADLCAAIRILSCATGCELRIATPWWKPARNQSALRPDYFLHQTDQWLVFPHELQGLDATELRRHKPALASALLDPE